MNCIKNADFEEDFQFFLFGKYYVTTRESELYIGTKNNLKIVLKISSLQELHKFAKIMKDTYACLHHKEHLDEEKTEEFSDGTKYVLSKQLQMTFYGQNRNQMPICDRSQLSLLCFTVSNIIPICYSLNFTEMLIFKTVFAKLNSTEQKGFFEKLKFNVTFKKELTMELSTELDMPSKSIIYCILNQHSETRCIESCFWLQFVGILE
jgi:hypothetical protein